MRALPTILALFTTASTAAAQCPSWSTGFEPSANGVNGLITSLATFDGGSGPELYACGYFTTASSVPAHAIARWNGTTWRALDPTAAIGGEIYNLAVMDTGTGPALYALGDFAVDPAGPVGPIRGAARWDGTSWSTTSSFQTIYDTGAVYDSGTGPALYAALYSSIGTCVFYRFDGTAWTWLDEFYGTFPRDMCVADLGSGPRLFVGTHDGKLLTYGGASLTPVALGAPFTIQSIEALGAFDNGNGEALYIGGYRDASVPHRGYVLRWDGTTCTDVGGAMTTSVSYGEVNALHVHDFGSGPRLVASGCFTGIGGIPASGIGVYDGASWSALGAGIGSSSTNGQPGALASFDAGDGAGPDLYAGGYFATAGGAPSQNIARYHACGGPTTVFCAGDGSVASCPCGNASAPGDGVGCLSSFGVGASLRTFGQASLAHDTLVLHGSAMPTTVAALYFQGANQAVGGFGFQSGDGVKCVGGPFARLWTQTNVGGSSQYPESVNAPISIKGGIGAPGTRHYQVRYRNPASFCTPDTFNYTNAVSVVWSL